MTDISVSLLFSHSIIQLFSHSINQLIKIDQIMFKFFFHISWRNLTKRGLFPVINIAGLSIGLSVVLLICLLIYNELSFDKSFRESNNIYRINAVLTAYMPGETYCSVNNVVGPAVEAAIPDVLATARTYKRSYVTRINDHILRIGLIWTDHDFFRLFDTPFLSGTPETAMTRPNAAAISEKMANQLFGRSNPLGEIFLLDNQHPMEVAAVYQDFPDNSSFSDYQIIAPYPYCYPASKLRQTIDWEDTDFETFCLLTEKADTAAVARQVRTVVSGLMGDDLPFFVPALQRLDKIHLHSSKYHRSNTSSPSDIGKVKMLTALAVIVLLVACFNYMNLSTARAQKRSKEIGLSKTIGAKRGELIARLTFETGVLTLLSFVLAFFLSFLLLPVFNNLLGEHLNFTLVLNPAFLLGVLLIWVVTTLVAASYPALYLSGLPPLSIIRRVGDSGMPAHATIRKILTAGQFVAAVVLIAWVIIIQAQIRYVDNKDIGFNPRHLVGIQTSLPDGSNLEPLVNDYRMQSSVLMASREHRFLFDGSRNILKRDSEDKQGIRLMTINVDHDFTGLVGLKFIAGSPLPVRNSGDTITRMVINRKAADYLGMTPEETIGKRILADFPEAPAEVCGVVEDFNYESLHRPVEAYGIYSGKRERPVIMLRVKEGDLSEQLASYERVFKSHFPNDLFEVKFPELELERAYDADRRTNSVALVFSVLAILVTCMGVFGLTAFMAEQRTKEIGVRKVLGASVGDIVRMFTDSYLRLLALSLVIAIPVAWWVGNSYLQDFAYRTDLGWWMFAAAAFITIALTLLTVGFQAVKAATANPVKAIKNN